ncbi:MAG TPA: four helix bundle protein [Gemmatimonadaceae bacterium]|jgi:four helix bundle protein|nr:four helix bundle protein [Gemmatimonadaceae bacterium]
MQDFKKLRVWHKALALALNTDRLVARITARRYAPLKNQLFRAASSIPANIAEGRRKKTDADFAKFLGIAAGSSSELESHLIFAHKSGIIGERQFVELVGQTIEVRKMLFALIRRLTKD